MGMWADYLRIRAGTRARKQNQRLLRSWATEAWLLLVLVGLVVGWPLYRLWRVLCAGGRNAKPAAKSTMRWVAPGPVPSRDPGRRTPRQRTVSGRWGAQ